MLGRVCKVPYRQVHAQMLSSVDDCFGEFLSKEEDLKLGKDLCRPSLEPRL